MNSSYKTVLVHIESSMLIVCDGAQALWYPDILAVNRAPSRLFLTVSSSPERVLTGIQPRPGRRFELYCSLISIIADLERQLKVVPSCYHE